MRGRPQSHGPADDTGSPMGGWTGCNRVAPVGRREGPAALPGVIDTGRVASPRLRLRRRKLGQAAGDETGGGLRAGPVVAGPGAGAPDGGEAVGPRLQGGDAAVTPGGHVGGQLDQAPGAELPGVTHFVQDRVTEPGGIGEGAGPDPDAGVAGVVDAPVATEPRMEPGVDGHPGPP